MGNTHKKDGLSNKNLLFFKEIPNSNMVFDSKAQNENLFFKKHEKSNFLNKSEDNIRKITHSSRSKTKSTPVEMKEIKLAAKFVNNSPFLESLLKVNLTFFQNSFINCNHAFVAEYEEERGRKTVHFSDGNNSLCEKIKNIHKIEKELLNFATTKNETANLIEKIVLKPIKSEIKNEKFFKIKPEDPRKKTKNHNILLNNLESERSFNQKKAEKNNYSLVNKTKNSFLTPRNDSNSSQQNFNSHKRINSKLKINNEISPNYSKKRKESIYSAKEDSLNKKNLPKKTQKDQTTENNLQKKPRKNTLNRKDSELSLKYSNNQTKSPTFSNSNRENFKKKLEIDPQNSDFSSRNSFNKAKENLPPRKSILKQRNPKFIQNNAIEDSFETKNRSDKSSFHTVCLTDLNESVRSRSKKSLSSKNSSSSEDDAVFLIEKKTKAPIIENKSFNPLKIYLKLDDLMNHNEKNDKNFEENKPKIKYNKGGIHKKNDNVTTTDTSKEDQLQTKFNSQNNLFKKNNESSFSSSDFRKIDEILSSNIELQNSKKNKNFPILQKKIKKISNGSNHISEEASEINKEDNE